MIDFHDDAIILSGETGTKLKCQILGGYYPLWWHITSGGASKEYSNSTAIIEMNAGSGEDYIEDTKETILGSSGLALQLKAHDINNTTNLKIILVEEDPECFNRLISVTNRNWPNIKFSMHYDATKNDSVYLFNNEATALEAVENLNLGNSLFFFDHLLYTSWSEIDRVARKRIKKYYKTGTEFIVFLFTSDWFQGRGKLVPLPINNDEKKWSYDESVTVSKVDELFGHKDWRPHILNSKDIEIKMKIFVDLYRDRLRYWFRYVVPLPFEPKTKQVYHLFMCSNYEEGASITKRYYVNYTLNQPYSPNNNETYSRFKTLHPDKVPRGSSRSDEWNLLWAIIKNHDDGICDLHCRDLMKKQIDYGLRKQALMWLVSQGYIKKINHFTNEWNNKPDLYRLDWKHIKTKLGVNPPSPPIPLSNVRTEPKQTQKIEKKSKTGLEEYF